MFCPVCKEKGLKSTVGNYGGTMTTLVSNPTWYDEDGNVHHHDTNMSTTPYICTNGHELIIKNSVSCPSYPENCDYFKPTEVKVVNN